MATDYEYASEYQKEKLKNYMLRLNVAYDAEMIQWIEEHKPFTAYIRKIVMEDMRRNGVQIEDRVDARLTTGKYIGWRDKAKAKKK